MRVLVLGLDGVSASVVDPLVDAGVTPTIGTILNDGCTTPLESQLPPWTPSAWPSIYTGVNPGKHGVFDFLKFDGYEWDVVNFSDVNEYTVWELLSIEGYSSVVLNAPVTHPPRAFDGAIVPGYTAPESPTCHPEGLFEELTAALGEYRLYNKSSSSGATERERIDGYDELASMRGEAFRYLADRFDPAFGFLQFQITDTVFHEFPDRTDAIETVFEAVDREIEKTLETVDPEYVLLLSDHGIGPYESVEFRVNDYLREIGAIETVAGSGGMPSWSSISRKRLRRGEEGKPEERSAGERALAAAARAGVTSQRIGAVLRALRLEDLVLGIVPMDLVRAGTERVDFESSTAYMRSRTEMGVRLNVAGREPSGTVPGNRYDEVRASIMESLRRVRTPEDEPVFDDVLPREAVFSGPYLEDAPDILTVPASFDVYLSASLRNQRFGDPSEPWEHKLEGILSISGPDVEPDAITETPHIFDIAPTILALFESQRSDRMDGRVLPITPDPGETQYGQFEPAPRTRTDDRSVENRLADLGYIE
ncbi:MAG: alkaline phosphatase family protein [Halobacteriota archaeon]